MKTRARWRKLATALGAFTLVLVVPEFASAQPNALFPDIYIKRQRPCPSLEDPRYRHIRENYYGYFPTCWRRFPEGWGCPSADAPNWAQALRDLPLDTGIDEEDVLPDPGGMLRRDTDPFGRPRPGAPDATGPGLELPRDEDVFQRNPAQPNGGAMLPGGGDETEPPAGGAGGAGQPIEGFDSGGSSVVDPVPGPATLVLPPRDDAATELAPPLVPPASSAPVTLPEALPTTSSRHGVVPSSLPRERPRRGLLSGLVGRTRRR